MKTITATKVRHQFGAVVEGLHTEPVLIEKSGRPVAVMLAYTEYERLQEIEDAWWGDQANQALADGLLGVDETAAWLKELKDQWNEAPTQ